MGVAEPRLFADARGVWRENAPGSPIGVAWDEVDGVSAHKLDGFTDVFTCIVIDWENGEFIELYHHWPGFGQVVAAITARLPGINPNWFEQVELLGTHDPSVQVWRRA